MIYNSANIDDALRILDNSPEEIWSIDLETYNPYEDAWFMDLSPKQRPLNRIDSKITSLQITTPSGIRMFFDFHQKQEGEDLRLDYKYLGEILSRCKSNDLIAHNAAFEYGMILRHGYDCPQDYYDTMIMGVLYNENMAQGLKPSVKQRFGHIMPSYQDTVGDGTMADLTAVECYDYGMSDTDWTLKLYDWYAERINMAYYENFEMDLIKIISKQYAGGQKFDEQRMQVIMAEDLEAREIIFDSFPELRDINMNSPKQVAAFLFNELGLKPFKVSKKTGAPSTDKESLFELESAYGKDYPIVKAFSDIRKLETRLKLYYRPYPKLVYPDGLLHSEIRQTGTVTGRFSSNSPNTQQVAKRGDGKKVRDVFIPHDGHDCIVCIDWSQIEMRIAAHMSSDPKLVDGYLTEKDMHTLSGTNISGLDYDTMVALVNKEDKEQKANRQKGKTLNFASLYLASPMRLAKFDLLDCTVPEAELFLAAHKIGYEGYFYKYVNEVSRFVNQNGFVKTLFGRIRHLPDIKSPIRALRTSAETQALNATIQGTAGDLMKLSLNKLWREDLLFKKDFQFIMQVHDEFVFSCTKEAAAALMPKVREIMQKTPKGFKVPIIAEVSVGINFGEQNELHGDLSLENITRKLQA